MQLQGKINILIVDDRPQNLLALEAIVENEDYNLLKAYSGEEALKYLLNYDFAVVLLDVQMPGLDGFETAKIVKSREKTKNIPILFITANNLDSEHIFMGYSVGAIDYILKPVDPNILKAKVEGFVELYKMKQQLIQQAKILDEKNKEIEHMAYHDGLTNLPNRRYLNVQLTKQLNHAKIKNQSFGLMYLDMDRFKYINDSLGHIMGDNLLQEVSRRLLLSVRDGDFVARVGGDEFNIILPDTDREDALEIAKKILQAFKKPFFIDDYELFITTGIGLSIFPDDGEESTALIKNADVALYRAKVQGMNKYKIFHSGMNIQSYRAFIMQNDLRKAIERDEFVLVYQPRVDSESGDVKSAEALLRWNHPSWGMISPLEFIPIAEETGQIVEIGEWVLRKVCEQINAWKEQQFVPVRIAVNFSSQQFLQNDLLDTIHRILEDTGVSPKLLEIEITESVILGNEEMVSNTLQYLKDMGMCISIDDFGTGYSSFNYLRKFPVDTIKIDKSFIHDISNDKSGSQAIISSISSLANNLNMSVVAEGVETEEQLNVIRKYQCQEFQGYIFSPPVLAKEFESFLYNEVQKDLLKHEHSYE